MDAHPDWVYFQTDFANAYNSILRCKSLEAVREHFPSLLPWLRAIYSPRSALWFDLLDDRQAMTSKAIRSVHCCFRSEEHTSELQSLMRISYAVFCLKKQNTPQN